MLTLKRDCASKPERETGEKVAQRQDSSRSAFARFELGLRTVSVSFSNEVVWKLSCAVLCCVSNFDNHTLCLFVPSQCLPRG